MRLHSSECPVDLDEVAQGYVLGTLPTEQAIAFEDHYAACDTCATVHAGGGEENCGVGEVVRCRPTAGRVNQACVACGRPNFECQF